METHERRSFARATTTRRDFLRTTAGAAAAATLAVPAVHAAEENTIKIALVGCGGRGSGATANALSTKGPVKLWAMADAFQPRLKASLKALGGQFATQVEVPPGRQFVGLDAYQKAIDAVAPGGVVLLATPPAFRPIHFEYAVQKGCHVFMEKSFAVDAPGVRRVLRAGELATRKNLKVAGGLMWRHDAARQEVIQRIHDGAIGEVILLRTYRMHGPWGLHTRPAGMRELEYQLTYWLNFTWAGNGFLAEAMVHNIDVCCWAKNAWPIAAQGQGGRLALTQPGQWYDHYNVEYFFADGTRLLAQGRHMNYCWDIYSDFAHGTKGSAVIMESLAATNPRIYRSQLQTRENETWRYRDRQPNPYEPGGRPFENLRQSGNPYQVEHDLLFDAIRQDKPYNEAQRCAMAAMAAIMGRMAAYSGQRVAWEQALSSNLELAPGLESYTWDSTPPVLPDKQGRYPIPIPGTVKAF
jgi:predicted dehydrogenase